MRFKPRDKLFTEKRSGSSTTNRPELKKCLDYLREGDTLTITRLDRLARSTLDLAQMANDLKQQGIDLIVLDQAVNTSTAEGKLLFNMLAVISEFENELRKERQLDGIAKAKQNGVKFGSKAKLTDEQVAEMRSKRLEGVLIKDLMSCYGISKATVYRLLSSIETASN